MLIFRISNDAGGWIDFLLVLMLENFDRILPEDDVSGFDRLLSILVNVMMDCADITVSDDAG